MHTTIAGTYFCEGAEEEEEEGAEGFDRAGWGVIMSWRKSSLESFSLDGGGTTKQHMEYSSCRM